MKYLSLFSGIGGFELGIQQAYESNSKCKHIGTQSSTEDSKKWGFRVIDESCEGICLADGTAPLCVGYSEIDKYAIQIYEKHFNHKNYGDITKINPMEFPDFDLVVGGFPCQSFSIAGKRAGFQDTRGTMFFYIATILREKKPRLLLLENVKGLLSHDNGNTFKTIITTLDELGYDLQWQVLNSKNFGVPQNRERVFIIGHLRGTPRPQVFPFTQNHSEDIILPTITTRITADSNGTYVGKRQAQKMKQVIGGRQGSRVVDPAGISQTLASQTGGKGGKTGLYMVDDPSRNKGLRKKEITPTLRSESHGNLPSVMQGVKIRRLTPKECERLQGFPDDWTRWGLRENHEDEFYEDMLIEISDTQRYKCLGNAVTVNVIKAIMEKLL